MPVKAHFTEFSTMKSAILTNLKQPLLHVYTYPCSFGEIAFNSTKNFMYDLCSNSNQVQQVKFEGTHHFHMINSEPVFKVIIDFLNKNSKITSKI